MLTDFHDTACDQPGYDNSHVNVIEVDGGRDNKLVFRVDPPPAVPPDTYLGVGDRIRITLGDFRIPADGINQALIGLSDSNPANTSEVLPSSAAPTTDDPEILVLTLPDLASLLSNEGEHLIITIGDGTGILAPQIPKGFHDPTLRDQEDGYPVEKTFVDASGASPDIPTDDENFVVVKNPVSSTEPGATVRVDLATRASDPIGGNEEITVDFSGPSDDTSFDIPSTISASGIKIRAGGKSLTPLMFWSRGKEWS